MSPKATEFGKITQNKGHYAIQSHSRSPISVPMRSPCDFLLVVNTNLRRISHSFQDIADYWSNLRFRQGVAVFNTLVQGDEPGNSGPHIVALKKQKRSLYRVILIYLQMIISFCHKA